MAELKNLADILSDNAGILEKELAKMGINEYSFQSPHLPMDFPVLSGVGSDARATVISAAEKILSMAQGPLFCLNKYIQTSFEAGTIRALIKLGVPSMVPLDDGMTYGEIALRTNVSESLIRRLIQLAIVSGFLREQGSKVHHSAMSSIFVRYPRAGQGTAWNFEVGPPSAAKIYEALQLDGSGQDLRKCPLSVEFKDDSGYPSIWELHSRDSSLDEGFHSLMASEGSLSLSSEEHIVAVFDWTNVKCLVDVGGGMGHATKALAKCYPHLQCTVQDTEQAISLGEPLHNVSFMTHDFFRPQSVHGDIYLLRSILHDWSDVDARRILAAILPALHNGARIAIMDLVVPELGREPQYIEKIIRGMDVQIYGLMAGKERTLGEFQQLVSDVSPSLVFEKCIRPAGSILSFMTWVYNETTTR